MVHEEWLAKPIDPEALLDRATNALSEPGGGGPGLAYHPRPRGF